MNTAMLPTTAAVDDNGIDLHRFEEDDIARDAIAHGGIGRVHEAAAVLHHEGGAAELMDVGERLAQD